MVKMIGQVVCNRPHYYRQVLETLAKCEGIKDWILIVNIEPVCEESLALAKAFNACETRIVVNQPRAGHTLNFYHAYNRAFHQGAEYVALCEDDALVAPDFLRWHEFAMERFRDDKTVWSVAGGNYLVRGMCDSKMLPFYSFHPGFMNKGWGTWRHIWFELGGMAERWERPETIINGKPHMNYQYCGYEGAIDKLHRRGRRQAYPIITRVNDIGEVGVNCDKHIFETQIKIIDWAGNYDTSGIEYQELTA